MTNAAVDEPLVLGPMLRYVDETSATVWVRTAASARVTVERAGRTWSAATVAVHGSHYALVVLDGLLPGTDDTYAVRVDDVPVWPRPGMPPSRIRTLDPNRLPHFAFGTCRTTGSHDAEGNKAHGVDALRTLALALRDDPDVRWPDVLLLLGDQVYADTTPHAELEEFMAARRSLDEPPGLEIKDFVEYAELYRLAWSEEVIRWVLSTVPSAMIFDDHDIRDDWNTSWSWQREIRTTTWWQERIVSGLGSYWLHQHLGNLSPAELAQEEVWRKVVEHEASGATDELDLTAQVDALAARADADPTSYRWSYTRALGDSTLVVIDSRAARELRPDGRSMLDADELRWVDDVLQRRGAAPVHRHLTAVPPAPRAARLRGDGRGTGPGRLRPHRGPGRREAAAEHRPRALGRLQRGVRRAVRAGHAGGPRRARPGAADDHLPLRRRAQLLPRRGHRPHPPGRAVTDAAGGVLTDPQPDAAGRAGVRVAVREIAGAADALHRDPLARRARAPTTPGRSPTGRGSTTTSRWSPWGRTSSR